MTRAFSAVANDTIAAAAAVRPTTPYPRAIAGDLIGDMGMPLPASKSQEKTWSKEIRPCLADWLIAEVVTQMQQDLQQQGLPATARAEGDKVFIDYTPLVFGTGYVPPTVILEFGT